MSGATTKEHLIEDAFTLIETTELAGLTLRPLAKRAGVSVATLNHHFGNKTALLETLVDQAAEREISFAQHWRDRLFKISVHNANDRAVLAKVIFDAWLGSNQREKLVLLDFIQTPNLLETKGSRLIAWHREMGLFWSEVFFGTDQFPQLALGFAIDEAAYTLAAPEDPAYAALRSLCLGRLIECQHGGDQTSEYLFASLVTSLRPGSLPARMADLKPRARTIVNRVADMLKEHDGEPITHRTVAAKCGISPATVVYQFGSIEELISAGLYGLIEKFHLRLKDKDDASPLPFSDIVRATGLIALKATRMPALREHAIDMRRRRGENVTIAALSEIGFPDHLSMDPAFRQVYAMCIFGTRRLAYAFGGPADHQAGQVVLDWALARAALPR